MGREGANKDSNEVEDGNRDGAGIVTVRGMETGTKKRVAAKTETGTGEASGAKMEKETGTGTGTKI